MDVNKNFVTTAIQEPATIAKQIVLERSLEAILQIRVNNIGMPNVSAASLSWLWLELNHTGSPDASAAKMNNPKARVLFPIYTGYFGLQTIKCKAYILLQTLVVFNFFKSPYNTFIRKRLKMI